MRMKTNFKIWCGVLRRFHVSVRFFEVAAILGFLDKDTWRTLFPPFKGWDIGCYYCDLHDRSVERGVCGYGERRGWKKCGRVIGETNDKMRLKSRRRNDD